MLTPQSELPSLPKTVSSYWPIHAYTMTQIVLTVGIFIVTLTIAGPAFPVLIIALVPARLFLMNRVWNRETLRFVDGWACRNGTPEDDEDSRMVDRAMEEQQLGQINHGTARADEESETGFSAIEMRPTVDMARQEKSGSGLSDR